MCRGAVMIFISMLPLLCATYAHAGAQRKTQVNKLDDFFQRTIPAFADFEADISRSRKENLGDAAKDNRQAEEFLPNAKDADKEREYLQNLSLEDAARAGRKNKGYGEFFDSGFATDRNAPGNRAHMRDADIIADSSEKYLKALVSGLKEHGIDCREQIKNEELEPQWRVAFDRKQEKETIYDQFFCEHLRNRYSCRDELTLQCISPSSIPSGLYLSSSSMDYENNSSERATSFRFSARYGGGGVNSFGGGRSGFLNIRRNSGGSTRDASSAEYSVNFNFSGNKEVANLSLRDISYGTFALIKLNGNVIYSGPRGGNNLYLNGHHAEERRGRRRYRAVGRRVTITDYYPKVDTGSGSYILGLGISGRSSYGYVDLLPYIRRGNNNLSAKFIGLGANAVSFTLVASENTCLNWRESWRETCSLNITEP